MTDRLTALAALKEAVKAGKFDAGVSFESAPLVDAAFPGPSPNTNWGNCLDALDGSVDAALSLRAAVLPGWDWIVAQDAGGKAEANVSKDENFPGFTCYNPDPARALLLAIIAAKIEGERNAAER
jgi:hypothetical protein